MFVITVNLSFIATLTNFINNGYYTKKKDSTDRSMNKNKYVSRISKFIIDENNDPAYNHIFKIIKNEVTHYEIPEESILCIVYFSLPTQFFKEINCSSDHNFFQNDLKLNLKKLNDLADSDITKQLENFNKMIFYYQSLLNDYNHVDNWEDNSEHKFVTKCRKILTHDMIKSNELTLKKFLSLHKPQYFDFLSTKFMLELYVDKYMTTNISIFESVLPEIIENDKLLTKIIPSLSNNKFSNSSVKKNKLYYSLKNCKDEVKIIPLSYEDSFITIFRLLQIHTLLIRQVSILSNKKKQPKMSELLEEIEKIYVFSQYIIECQTLIFDENIQEKYYKYINQLNYAALFRELNKTSFAIINLLFNGVTKPQTVTITDKKNNKETKEEIYFYLFKKQSKGMLLTKLQNSSFDNFLIDFKKVEAQFNYDIKKMIREVKIN